MTYFYSNWSATPPNGGAKYRLRLEVKVVGTNVAANQTTVEWELIMQKDRNWDGFWAYSGRTWGVTVGSVVLATSGTNPNSEWLGWASKVIAGPQRETFTHNDDGSKSIGIAAYYDGAATGWAVGGMSIVGETMVLPTIARATVASVTPSPASVGNVVDISLPKAVASYTHDLTWECDTLSGTIATSVSATSTPWTVPDVLSEYPTKSLKPIVITVVTRLGATTIGSTQVTLFAMTPPAPPSADSPAPSEQFDVRARLVTHDGTDWTAKKDIPSASLSIVESANATTTISLSVSSLIDATDYEDAVVDVDVYNGERWVFTNHRFILSRVEDNAIDPSAVSNYSGTEFVDYVLQYAQTQAKSAWNGGGNPGMIMKYLIDKAKSRGWGPLIGYDFSTTKTSLGEKWAKTSIDLEVSKGTPASQVLSGLVEDGVVEYRTEYRDNKAYLVLLNPGTGSNFASIGANPVVNLALAKLTSAPRRRTSEGKLSRVTVEYGKDGSALTTRETTPTDPTVIGHLEGWVTANTIGKKTSANNLGDNTLSDMALAVSERTFEFKSKDVAPQYYPHLVYRSGDWVMIPDGDNTTVERVAQTTISKDAEAEIAITVVTGDRILSGTAAIRKKQEAQTGSAISGGTGNTSGTLASRIPSAPILTGVTSVGYWNSDGAARAEVTIGWAEVATSIEGDEIDVDMYEVWWRSGIAGIWSFRGATDQLTIDLPDWDTVTALEFRVRARSAAGVFGEFSTDTSHTTTAPSTPMSAPDTPVVTANALGTLFMEWNGKLGGSAVPVQFAYTRVEISASGAGAFSPAGVPLLSAGSTSLDPGTYGTWDIRMIAVDRLGIESAPSSVVSITTTDPGLVLRTPEAPDNLAYTTDSAFTADGTRVEAWFDFTWDAVTEDTDGDPIVVSAYEIWGKEVGGTSMNLMTTGTANAARAYVEPGSDWLVEVRAISDVGARGLFSTTLSALANGTVATLGTPSTPTVTSTRGLIRVDWDGLIDGVEPPTSFRYIKVEYAPTATLVYSLAGATFTRGGGAIFIPGEVGVDYTVRFTPVDGGGVSGNQSATASVEVVGIDAIDFTPIIENMLTEPRIETDSAENTGVKLFNGGIVAYNAAGEPTVLINAEDGSLYFAQGVIDGDAIITGTLLADKIDVSSLVATLVASPLGNSLNLASNDSVNILVGGAVASVQDGVDALESELGTMQTYYQYGPDGVLITSPSSVFAVKISNSQIDMMASGISVSRWNASGLVAASLTAEQTATIGAHQHRREGVRTTIRAL